MKELKEPTYKDFGEMLQRIGAECKKLGKTPLEYGDMDYSLKEIVNRETRHAYDLYVAPWVKDVINEYKHYKEIGE